MCSWIAVGPAGSSPWKPAMMQTVGRSRSGSGREIRMIGYERSGYVTLPISLTSNSPPAVVRSFATISSNVGRLSVGAMLARILMMKTSLFEYHLPKSRIAQRPVRPRDSSRLLVLDRKTGDIKHRVFRDIIEYLRPGDLLVMNDTKVFRARLRVKTERGMIEIFLIHPERMRYWIVLARPGKKLAVGARVVLAGGLSGTVASKQSDGTIRMRFNHTSSRVIEIANRIGEVPIPPYITRTPKSLEEYQTVYARRTGSRPAPTAGFPFSPRLIRVIKPNGIRIAFVTLHVGLGTFQPVKTEKLEEYVMHAEWGEIPAATTRAVRKAKRVIAVGTTTVRALEGLWDKPRRRGWIRLFIQPGYRFKVVDALITNFHLPRSTLLALVSAFAGRERILRAYRAAVRRAYRFYSFGDAMFIH